MVNAITRLSIYKPQWKTNTDGHILSGRFGCFWNPHCRASTSEFGH